MQLPAACAGSAAAHATGQPRISRLPLLHRDLRAAAIVAGLPPSVLSLAAGFSHRAMRRQPRVTRFRGKRMRDKLYRPRTSIAGAPLVFTPRQPHGGTHICSGIAELVERYDAFMLDQYGVLHDGQSCYDGVQECLQRVRDAGKRSVILSNSSGRSSVQQAKLPGIGINPDLVDGVVTSGELAHRYLGRYQEKLGSRVLWIAWHDNQDRGLGHYFSDLEGYSLSERVEDADFILASGVGSIFAGTPSAVSTKFERDGDSVPFEQTFRLAIARSLPMICANPDKTAIRPGGWVANLTGALAEHYKRLGGRVIYFGKPYTASFEEAYRILNEVEAGKRVCHVGDSLQHDVKGASAVGLDAAFVVRNGVHAKDLPKALRPEHVQQLCRKEETPMPAFILERFVW
mmetsp:Transcript_89521/g.208502  ORF Transcript_89521/g.208502 Transcript_89521/m.208502 type:complete len:401 (+) Transcript_89521:72-1274(+)